MMMPHEQSELILWNAHHPLFPPATIVSCSLPVLSVPSAPLEFIPPIVKCDEASWTCYSKGGAQLTEGAEQAVGLA